MTFLLAAADKKVIKEAAAAATKKEESFPTHIYKKGKALGKRECPRGKMLLPSFSSGV